MSKLGKAIGVYESYDEVAELKAEIARLKAEREWQPIGTAKIGEKVLMFGGKDFAVIDRVNKTYKAIMSLWQPIPSPLPQPPEDAK